MSRMIQPHQFQIVNDMNERFTVRLRKAVHVFCAGHFITLTDDLCEAVHGHNWLVGR